MRILPVAAATLALVLGLKLTGTISEFGSARAEENAEHALDPKPAPPASAAGDHAEKESARASDGEERSEEGQTASEADVLESLATRREQLDERERQLDMREKVVAAAEKRIEERIGELKNIEAQVEVMFGQRDDQEKAQLVSLIKTYEAMKPADAAEIFNTLNRQVLLDVITGMKPAKVAPILAAMQPDKAQEVTVAIAARYAMPEQAAAPPPTESAPPSQPTADPPPEAAPGG